MAQMLRKSGSSNSYLTALHRVTRALRILPDGADYVRTLQGPGEALETTQQNGLTLKRTILDLRVDQEMADKKLYADCKTLHGRAAELDREDMTSSVLPALFLPSGNLTAIPHRGQALLDASLALLGRLQGLGAGHPLAERAASLQERIAACNTAAAALRNAEQAHRQARDQELMAQKILAKAYDDAYLAVRGKYGAKHADEIFRYATLSRSKAAPEPAPQTDSSAPRLGSPEAADLDSAALLEMAKNLFKHLRDLQKVEIVTSSSTFAEGGNGASRPSALPGNHSMPLLSAPPATQPGAP